MRRYQHRADRLKSFERVKQRFHPWSSVAQGPVAQDRVVILVDALSLYYGALQLNIEIDYGLLLQYLARDCRLVHAFFYTGIDLVERLTSHQGTSGIKQPRARPVTVTQKTRPKTRPKPVSKTPLKPHPRRQRSSHGTGHGTETNRQFLEWLRRQGYRVITKEVQRFPDGSQKLDLDVEIAIDMMKLAEACDRMILVSGGDTLAYAVKVVSDRGVRSEVVSLREMTSHRLLEAADDYCDLYTIQEQIQLK